MVAAEGSSEIRYQLPPYQVDLSAHAREQVMVEHPILWRVTAQEMAREGKLRPFGVVDGEKIGDPRNYLYLEMKGANRDSALAALVRLRGETVWRSSHLGRADYAISRDGWVTTTIELPPGTPSEAVEEFGFECLVAPVKPEPVAGVCRLEAVPKVFRLDRDYHAGPGLLAPARAGGTADGDYSGVRSRRARSKSSLSVRTILSATSELAPRNFPPVLSWVVDQITSPSLFTSRTAATAS